MVLRINGEVVPEEIVQIEMEGLRAAYDHYVRSQGVGGNDEQLREWSRENVIERVLLHQAALRQPPPTDATAADAVNPETAVDTLIEVIGAAAPAPGEEDIRQYYRNHRSEFRQPDSVHAAHIIKHVGDPAARDRAYVDILNVKARLDAGATFEELAFHASDCPDTGGDLGTFTRGQMVQAFEDVVFAMSPGQVSDVFETPFGFHIAKVYDRKAGGIAPLAAVRENIVAAIMHDRRTDALHTYLDQLKAEARIEESAE